MSNLAPNPADPTQRIISAFQTAQAAGRQPRMSDIVGGAIDAMVLQFRHNGGDILHTEDKWYQFNPGIGIWVIRRYTSKPLSRVVLTSLAWCLTSLYGQRF